jgi:hypothetical protein
MGEKIFKYQQWLLYLCRLVLVVGFMVALDSYYVLGEGMGISANSYLKFGMTWLKDDRWESIE